MRHASAGVDSEYVFRGIDYLLAVAAIYNIRVGARLHAYAHPLPHAEIWQLLYSVMLAGSQAIVVPVNNWLDTGVGDGKQQAPLLLSS